MIDDCLREYFLTIKRDVVAELRAGGGVVKRNAPDPLCYCIRAAQGSTVGLAAIDFSMDFFLEFCSDGTLVCESAEEERRRNSGSAYIMKLNPLLEKSDV